MFTTTGSWKARAIAYLMAVSAVLGSGEAYASTPLETTLVDFEDGTVAGAVGVAVANAPVTGNSLTVVANADDEASKRLKITDADGFRNGVVLTIPQAIPAPGYYLITADVKVDNPSAGIASFGMAATLGGTTNVEISDVNAGYVMNLAGQNDGAKGYQTIGAAVQVPAGGSFPSDLTLYFSTDPSSNTFNAPAADGDFIGGHRGLNGWLGGTSNAVYVDNIKRHGPGNFGEERHLWISVGDGYTDLAKLENLLVQAKANNFNAVDILARYRADAYYVPNRADATYPNPEQFGNRVGTIAASATNDPLQYAIDRCRELGLKVYISFSSFLVSPNNTYPSTLSEDTKMWFYNAGAPRPMVNTDTSAEGLWADLTRADVREYTKNVLMDIVRNYDIDGVIFDRIRYPRNEYSYNPGGLAELGYTSTLPAPSDANFREKRRDVITAFLQECYQAVTTEKPWVVVGATPIAFSDNLVDTYNSVLQYWPKWMSAKTGNRNVSFGCVDLMQPQFYRLWNTTPSSLAAPASNTRLVQKAQFGDVVNFPRDFGMSPGALTALAPLFYHPNSSDANQSNANAQNITDSRGLAANGWGLFAGTTTINDINLIRQPGASTAGVDVLATPSTGNDYLFKAGYEKIAPNAPTNFDAQVQSRGSVVLTWDAPAAASDGDNAAGYYIYKSTTLPVREIYANQINKLPLPGDTTWYHAPVGDAGNYHYKIVAIDDYNNRSAATVIGPFTVPGAPTTPAEIIVDNIDATFTGTWGTGTAADRYGINYRSAFLSGTNVATYPVNIPQTGTYDVFEWHSQGSNRAGDAKHIINHAGGQSTVLVNQVSNGGKWNKIGTYSFNQGATTIVINNQFTVGSVVIADALRLTYVVPPNPAPAAPTNLQATATVPHQIDLTWADNASNETGYEIERTIAGGETIIISNLPANSTSFSDTSLAVDTEYSYVVRAYTNGAQSADSNRLNARTLPELPPDIIIDNADPGVQVVGTWSTTTSGAKWGANAKFVSAGTGTRYHRFFFTPARTAVYDLFEWHVAGTNRATNTPHVVVHQGGASTILVDQKLPANSAKWNQFARFQFTGGVQYSVTISDAFTGPTGTIGIADAIRVAYVSEPPTTPAAPSDLEATVISDTEISLSWTDNSVNETGFEVERTGPDNVPTIVASLGADAVSFSDTGLTALTSYTYTVRAINAAGKSAAAAPVTATTLASTPPDVIVDTQAAVLTGTWTIQTTAADKFGTTYAFKGKNTGGQATFNFRTRDLGLYEIYEWHPAGSNRPPEARHTVNHRDGSSLVLVNQTVNGGKWNKIGTYAFNGATDYSLIIDDQFSVGTVVMADAIKVVWLGELPAVPSAPTGLAAAAGSSAVNLTWADNSNDESGFVVVRNGSVIASLPDNSSSYSDSSAPECTPNSYVVRAVNLGGASADSNTATITVDFTKPTITAPANIAVNTDAGVCGATVALGTPTTNDNCGVDSVTNNAPETFPVGTTTVTWTVKDAAGNEATATQEVVVTDSELPTITAPATVSVNTDAGVCGAEAVDLGTPTTADNCGVAEVANDAPAIFPVGTTTVTWTVTDANGNIVTATQDVTVTDNEAPAITAPADVTANNDSGLCSASNVELGTPTTSDNCEVASVTSDAPSVYPKGDTTVTWTVTDIHGNSATATQVVTVVDAEAPVLADLADITLGCSVDLLVPATWEAVASDNCGEVTVVSSPASGSGFPVGSTTVTVTATDAAGNETVKTFTVTRAALGFQGFLSPVGGEGGSADQPVLIAKLNSTVPLKMTLGCDEAPVVTGIHKVTIQKFDSVAGMGEAVDATPTDAATTGNQFRLAEDKWQFNWKTKGLTKGSYRVLATLSDGSTHEVWIDLK